MLVGFYIYFDILLKMSSRKFSQFNILNTLIILALILVYGKCLSEKYSFANQTKRQMVIEDQIQNLLHKVSNKTIAILTNPTSTDSYMQPLF